VTRPKNHKSRSEIAMIMRNRKTVGFLAVAAALLLSACASQMEPAQKAIAGIDSAVSAAAPDAGKYVPDQLAAVQKKLDDLKTAFANKDYATVVTGAPAVMTEAQGLLGAAMLKKDEVVKAMSAQWPALAASLPGLVTSVTNKVNALAKMKQAPAGVDVAAAKASIADAGTQWTKAHCGIRRGQRRGSRQYRERREGKGRSRCRSDQDDAAEAGDAAPAAAAPAK
jgi:hypothetical protein